MPAAGVGTKIDWAAVALRLRDRAKDDPKGVISEGRTLLPHARRDAPAGERTLLLCALADASRAASTMVESVAYAQEAVASARETAREALVVDAQVTLAGSLALSGRTSEALTVLAEAGTHADEQTRSRVEFQRAAVLGRAGQPAAAVEAYSSALRHLKPGRDQLLRAHSLANRGALRAPLGELAGAKQDLTLALRSYRTLGLVAAAAYTEHNLGLVAHQRGDLPEALRRFDASESVLAHVTDTVFEAQVSRCDALLSAGLFEEAQALAMDIRARTHAAGLALDEAEAALTAAYAFFLDAKTTEAARLADQAERLFADQDRPGYAAQARYLQLRVLPTQEAGVGHRDQARLLAAELGRAGLAVAARQARLLAGQLSLALGDLAGARTDLTPLGRASRSGPVELRMHAWHAQAMLRLAEDDDVGADRAARSAFTMLERHQAVIGAIDVRAGLSAHAEELGHIGLSLAIRSGRATRAFDWAERTRARALRVRPVWPPEDDVLAAQLARLRVLGQRLQRSSPDERSGLERERTAVQDEIRRHSRHASLDDLTALRSRPVAEVRHLLGDRSLVHLVVADGAAHGIVVESKRCRLVPLGPSAVADQAVRDLRSAIRRMAAGRSVEQAAQLVRRAAVEFDQAILAPLRLRDGPLVLVPPTDWYAVPWSVLPSCRGRAVSVAPSATQWASAVTQPASGTRVVLVAGPDLQHAGAEIDSLRRLHRRARVFESGSSLVADVISAIDGAALVHVACHGEFRRDNALFSSLRLADGDLNVHELHAVDVAPNVVILSACDSALSAGWPGRELVGLSSALLALGTGTLIASIGLLPDSSSTLDLVEHLHRNLRAGARPAAALADAQLSSLHDADDLVSSASLVCFGAG